MIDYHEEAKLDYATTLEHARLTVKQLHILDIIAQMAVEDRLLHED